MRFLVGAFRLCAQHPTRVDDSSFCGRLTNGADEDAIKSLVDHIGEWTGAQRLKDAAVSAVSRADKVAVHRALYTLAEKGVGTDPEVKSWIKIRNSVMHGKLVSPYSTKEDDQIILDLADLLRALTREAARQALASSLDATTASD
ncbi:hypothetical protein Rleg10DRAFT_7162 [Rhizobium leguminosarum bv. trifolii WSM2012]|nr:hypothetical protein Rleg10DRAFT_7162 [Rhizobium leguminosarum bv. trifolii WSM2012]